MVCHIISTNYSYMKSKTYYGEYSLMHWVNMMLTNNITLPEYQRSFVWGEKDIKRLLKSIAEGQFVQPVTIALYPDYTSKKKTNLILDGQQRLTSILLAYLGYIPDLSKFAKDDMLATGDDSADEDNEVSAKAIKWTFKEIFDKDPNKNQIEQIRSRLAADENYKVLDVEGIDNNGNKEQAIVDYLKNKFLGFSYIVPDTTDMVEIQNGYTSLFRNINYFGKKLTTLGSRRSLYYTNEDLKNYFEGTDEHGNSVLCGITIKENMDYNTIDFVRYLSTLSQYKVNGNTGNILKYYSAYSSRESYFADYVSYILQLDQEDRYDKFNGFNFNEVFINDSWKERYKRLKDSVERMKNEWNLETKDNKSAFLSWIDADYWLYGLIYHIVFEGKELNDDINQLFVKVKKAIRSKKNNHSYSKTPNGLTNLRDRIQDSIKIYQPHVH